MGYATPQDLEARFGADELVARTDRTGSGLIDQAAVSRALADAAAEIDGYVAARYRLPLPALPAVLTRIACDIARYRLWQDAASDEVRSRYEDARRLLEGIARGLVSLGLAEEDRPSPSLAAARAGPPPLFTRDETAGF